MFNTNKHLLSEQSLHEPPTSWIRCQYASNKETNGPLLTLETICLFPKSINAASSFLLLFLRIRFSEFSLHGSMVNVAWTWSLLREEAKEGNSISTTKHDSGCYDALNISYFHVIASLSLSNCASHFCPLPGGKRDRAKAVWDEADIWGLRSSLQSNLAGAVRFSQVGCEKTTIYWQLQHWTDKYSQRNSVNLISKLETASTSC